MGIFHLGVGVVLTTQHVVGGGNFFRVGVDTISTPPPNSFVLLCYVVSCCVVLWCVTFYLVLCCISNVCCPNTHCSPTQRNATQHNTTQHNTTQHNTTQQSTTQHKTTQDKTTQHNTTRTRCCMSRLDVLPFCLTGDRGGSRVFSRSVLELCQHNSGRVNNMPFAHDTKYPP